MFRVWLRACIDLYIYIYIYTRLPRSFYLEPKNRKTSGQRRDFGCLELQATSGPSVCHHVPCIKFHQTPGRATLFSHVLLFQNQQVVWISSNTRALPSQRNCTLNLSKPRRVECGHSSRPLARRFAFAVRCFRQQDLMLGVITCEPTG